VSTLFSVQTGLPSRVTAGEQDSWTEVFADYPNASYSVAYIFASNTPVDGFQQYTVTGTETSTATRTFTLPAAIKPGVYDYEVRVTRQSDSVTRVARRGCLIVAPDLATTPTTTDAQTKVAALKTAIDGLNASSNRSVSFNGQSVTKANLPELQQQLAYWESRVIRERNALAVLSSAVAQYNCDCNCR
jgi:hypothetical protein